MRAVLLAALLGLVPAASIAAVHVQDLHDSNSQALAAVHFKKPT